MYLIFDHVPDLVTNMYQIFEVGHLERAMTAMAQIKPFNMTKVGKMLPDCYSTAITLAVMTYRLHKQHYRGMFAYGAWITFYDLANCLVMALAYQVSKEAWFSLSPLEWFGLATRIPMDCFWLSFVVTRGGFRHQRSKHVPGAASRGGRPAGPREGGSQAAFGSLPAGGPPVPWVRWQFGGRYAEGAGPADHPQTRRRRQPDCRAWGGKKHRATPGCHVCPDDY
ncbi:carnitine dehydratase [Platysternon megacephalum]|uniref:Carnitine dehydratase n=1 Tax=Platysternon megacephalum TaxID=55544 RepID=A0A4D9DJT5_9SAUR|nr:carnitine dehydratase [Platysternon megacephalum]